MIDNIGSHYIFNGEICNFSNTGDSTFKPSVLLTGDLYEVLRAIDGKLLFYHDHIERLRNSLRLSNINFSIDELKLKQDLLKLIKICGYESCNLKIVITTYNNKRCLYAYLSKYYYPDESVYKDGVKVGLLQIERSNPNAKIINVDYKQKVSQAIEENNLFEVLLVNKNGYITEGSRTNVFVINNNIVFTASKEQVLEGITRKYVFKACERCGIDIVEKALSTDELKKSEGLFLSGTSIKTLPVSSIDDITFNTGSNPVFIQILNAFNNIMKENLED